MDVDSAIQASVANTADLSDDEDDGAADVEAKAQSLQRECEQDLQRGHDDTWFHIIEYVLGIRDEHCIAVNGAGNGS